MKLVLALLIVLSSSCAITPYRKYENYKWGCLDALADIGYEGNAQEECDFIVNRQIWIEERLQLRQPKRDQ